MGKRPEYREAVNCPDRNQEIEASIGFGESHMTKFSIFVAFINKPERDNVQITRADGGR